MNLYGKNPKIEGTICIQGKTLDDDSIVFGKEFDMFADPRTFPDIEVKLVRVSFNDLTDTQKMKLQGFEGQLQPKPPRHLGPSTTANFKNAGDGSVKMAAKPEKFIPPPQEVVEAPKVVETVEVKEPEVKSTAQVIQDEENEPVRIDEFFSNAEFVDDFAGITDANVEKVLEKFETLDDLVSASNTDLRASGIRSNFFGRVRDRATEVLEEIAESDTVEE